MVAYDYTSLNGSGDKAKQVADLIKADLQQVQKGFRAMIRVGLHLDSIKESIPHGEWAAWLEAEFDMSDRTARRYMQIGRKFKTVSVGQFTEEVLELLTRTDVPQKAVDKVISEGATKDRERAKKIVNEVAPPKPKKAPVNRIAHHLGASSPVEFAKDEPVQTVEPSVPEAKVPVEPAPEAKPIEPVVSQSIRSLEDEVTDAFKECKRDSEDPSEFAFEQAIEIIRQGIAIVNQLSGEYQQRARAEIDKLLPRKAEADKASPVGKSEAVSATAQPQPKVEPVAELQPEPGKLIPFDALDVRLPEKLDVPRFRKTWTKWVRFNELEGKPLNELVAEAQIKQLGGRSMEAAVSAIETAIASRTTVLPKGKDSRPTFVPPTPEQVDAYVDTLEGSTHFTGQEFCDYYAKSGWKIKGHKMADWQAAVRTWVKNDRSNGSNGGQTGAGPYKQAKPTGPRGSAAVGGANEKWKPTRPLAR